MSILGGNWKENKFSLCIWLLIIFCFAMNGNEACAVETEADQVKIAKVCMTTYPEVNTARCMDVHLAAIALMQMWVKEWSDDEREIAKLKAITFACLDSMNTHDYTVVAVHLSFTHDGAHRLSFQ